MNGFDKELDKLLQPYAATEISEAIKQAVDKYVIGEYSKYPSHYNVSDALAEQRQSLFGDK